MSAQSIGILSLTATAGSGGVTVNRFVGYDGSVASTDEATIGVATTTAASGVLYTLVTIGTAIVEAGAAITAGDVLKVDSSGRGITWVTSGAKVGRALQAATAAGQLIEVRLLDNV